jgi:amino acid transporter
MVAAATWVLLNAAGYDFVMAIDYVFVNGLSYGLPTAPYFTLFAGVVTQNIALQALMAIGFICWCLAIPLVNCIQVPRWLLAMSFDRVLPSKLADVSRFGTPWVGVLVMAVASEMMLVIYTTFAGVLATVSAAFANIVATFMVACIAAVAIPFRKRTRSAYETAPKLATLKLAGLPVMSLAGILGALFLGWVSLEYAVNAAFGANNVPSLLAVGGIYVAGLVVYFVSKSIRSKQGIDISLALSEIPPE